MTRLSRKRVLIALSYSAVCIFWGMTYIWNRMALSALPPFFLAGTRFIVAGGLLITALRLGGQPWPTRRQWVSCTILGFIMPAVGSGGVAFAQTLIGAGVASLGYATSPLWAVLFSVALMGRRPRGLEWLGIALGFAGLALLRSNADFSAQPIGLVAILIAAASWALGSTILSKFDMPPGLMASPAQLLPASAFMFMASIVTGEQVVLPVEARPYIGLVCLILFGSIVNFTCYNFLLRNIRTSLATTYIYINPLVAVGLGVLLEGETATAIELASMIIILAGVALVALARARASPRRASSTAHALSDVAH